MKTIKVAEATELQLDWLVAKCEGLELIKDGVLNGFINEGWFASGYYVDRNNWVSIFMLCYATDWNETSELKYLTHWMPLPPLPGNAARKQGGA